MLDDLADVVEPEDINSSPIAVAWPLLMAMQDNVVILGNRPLEVDAFSRVFLGHPRKVLDERLFAVGDVWIMLNVHIADVPLDRFGRLTSVEHQIIERHHGLFVLLKSIRHRQASKASMLCNNQS
jgi:hypothetical protein